MKSKKVEEMTIEEKAKKFEENHPEYLKKFESLEAKLSYLLQMNKELKTKKEILDRCIKVLKNHHHQVELINELKISSHQQIKLLKLNAVNTLREHIKTEWVYEIADKNEIIIQHKQDAVILIFLLDLIDKNCWKN